jgi:hypothetical protein
MHLLLNSFSLPVLIVFVVGAILLLCWPSKVLYAISRNRKISESVFPQRQPAQPWIIVGRISGRRYYSS